MATPSLADILLSLVSSGPLYPTTPARAGAWDTALSPEQEQEFSLWGNEQERRLGRPVLADLADYDLRGLYQSTAGAALEPGHFTDRFKKPNHPTFSTQSQYSGRDGMVGGEWIEGPSGWEFRASRHNVANLGPEGLRRYFARAEPNAKLALPDAAALAELLGMTPGKGR